MKTVVIFGVFDGLHEGHRAFIQEAKTYGDKLIAIIARDENVSRLKNRNSKNNEEKRLSEIKTLPDIYEAYLGDEKEGEYALLKSISPDSICLGYDQQGLLENIKENIKIGMLPSMTLVIAKPFKPDEFHSSILY